MLVGLILLAVGVMWLLESLGLITPDWTDSAWPVILIALGAWMIYHRARFGRRGWLCTWR